MNGKYVQQAFPASQSSSSSSATLYELRVEDLQPCRNLQCTINNPVSVREAISSSPPLVRSGRAPHPVRTSSRPPVKAPATAPPSSTTSTNSSPPHTPARPPLSKPTTSLSRARCTVYSSGSTSANGPRSTSRTTTGCSTYTSAC